MFENFTKFIPKAANHYGIGRQITASYICELFRKLIPEFFPKSVQNQQTESTMGHQSNIQPVYFKENTLTIQVSSSAWAQEVTMKKHKIITRINEELKKSQAVKANSHAIRANARIMEAKKQLSISETSVEVLQIEQIKVQVKPLQKENPPPELSS